MQFTSGVSILIHDFISFPDAETDIAVLGVESFIRLYILASAGILICPPSRRSVHIGFGANPMGVCVHVRIHICVRVLVRVASFRTLSSKQVRGI